MFAQQSLQPDLSRLGLLARCRSAFLTIFGLQPCIIQTIQVALSRKLDFTLLVIHASV